MAKLSDILRFLDDYLELGAIPDKSFNGLQVEGKEDVKKIVGAVDAGVEVINAAIESGADMILVHHGLFWSGDDPSIKGHNRKRIKPLLDNDVSFVGVHLPLDMHRDVGNNARIASLLGASIKDGFLCMDGRCVGWTAEFSPAKSMDDIVRVVEENIRSDLTVLPFGKENVRTVSICSGGVRTSAFFEAASCSDLFITGEPLDIYQFAKDMELNVIFAGHNATEVFGVKALLDVLEEKFGVETEFLDFPTGI